MNLDKSSRKHVHTSSEMILNCFTYIFEVFVSRSSCDS